MSIYSASIPSPLAYYNIPWTISQITIAYLNSNNLQYANVCTPPRTQALSSFYRSSSISHPSTNIDNRKLDGSCQCGGVEFTLQSQTPVPYQLCACSICRKVGGYSGSVNLGGIADSLKIHRGKGLIKYEPPDYPTSNLGS